MKIDALIRILDKVVDNEHLIKMEKAILDNLMPKIEEIKEEE